MRPNLEAVILQTPELSIDKLTSCENPIRGTKYNILNRQLQLDLTKHNAQYEPVNIYESNNFHDRFLITDNVVYHIGASLKDLGKKLFAFSKMEVEVSVLLNV